MRCRTVFRQHRRQVLPAALLDGQRSLRQPLRQWHRARSGSRREPEFDTQQAAALQGVWQLQTLVFAATSARTALRFCNTQYPLLHYALIDAVSVSTVPELPSGQWVLFGLALLLLARRRGLHA